MNSAQYKRCLMEIAGTISKEICSAQNLDADRFWETAVTLAENVLDTFFADNPEAEPDDHDTETDDNRLLEDL